ncbi:hypothetical protein EVAR_10680_1 [Eumeta japonica]|uniref:Reverse transcriptase domain-containing protein n=1 Tax=Eumeta variegata TaxID=151549 RepID=A0A4C1U7C7_EUMVA|nr:hypothetical protein EVAR_10680_1 [Eumeta japonica]
MVMSYLRDRKVVVRDVGRNSKVQAFADYVLLMFFGESASALEAEANQALAYMKNWGDRNEIRFAPSKTNAICSPKKLKFYVSLYTGAS